MTRTEILAEIYSLPPDDVARWPAPVAEVLHRNAIHRGWLTPEPSDETEARP